MVGEGKEIPTMIHFNTSGHFLKVMVGGFDKDYWCNSKWQQADNPFLDPKFAGSEKAVALED